MVEMTKCVCGCERELPEGHPSEWFMDVDCQEVWARRNADRPEEVLGTSIARYFAPARPYRYQCKGSNSPDECTCPDCS